MDAVNVVYLTLNLNGKAVGWLRKLFLFELTI
jgi:hypothetical protein